MTDTEITGKRTAIGLLTRLQYANLTIDKDSIELLKMSGAGAIDYLGTVLGDPDIERKIAPMVVGGILGMDQLVPTAIFLVKAREFAARRT